MPLVLMDMLAKPTLGFSQALLSNTQISAASGSSRTFAVGMLIFACAALVLLLLMAFALPRKPGRERQRKRARRSLPFVTALLVLQIIRVTTGSP